MAYLSLYRKWRPQTFADVVGQKHVVRTIVNALDRQRVAHAYLFCGPRGTGKTTVARLLAKGLNCHQGPTGAICNTCESCQEISRGTALDVIEIDGASNRGIDEIREIRERVHYAPTQGRYKVYIVDEVHMLTNEAFNALLKMLEEPPAHVFFIFATTEAHKIPATIISRCQRFDFRNFQAEELLEQLKKVLDGEGIPYDIDALRLVARHAAGGMRDALAVLDQCIAYNPDEVNAGVVQDVLGVAPRRQLLRFAQAHQNKDIGELLTVVREMEHAGVDLPQFIREAMQYYRDLMMIKAAGERATHHIHLLAEEKAEAIKLAEAFSLPELVRSIEVLGDVNDAIRWAPSSALAVEIACVKLVHRAVAPDSAEATQHTTSTPSTAAVRVERRSGHLADTKQGTSSNAATTHMSAAEARAKEADVETERKGQRKSTQAARQSETATGAVVGMSKEQDDVQGNSDDVQRLWERLLETLRSERMRQIEAFLCEGHPVHLDKEKLVVVFPETRAFHHASMNNANNKQTAEKVLSKLAGQSIRLELHLGEAPVTVDSQSGDVPSDAHNATTRSESKATDKQEVELKRERDKEYEPIVEEALHIFDGTIVDARREEDYIP